MPAQNVARKLIEAHLEAGEMTPGDEIAIRIDQTLTQDATGTLVMQELESLGLDRARTEVSVQYVDHNLLQTDEKNAEDHEYLRTACERFGLWFSKPGNGVSHPTHMQRFGIPGKTMVGSDSHTPAAGSLGMLAIGVGGLEVALAITGRPLNIRMPEIWGIKLEGELPPWCSAKDVILEMLRRHDVKGAVNRIIEYHGPGLGSLTAMDRHVIANMGAELGATTTVFPSDDAVREFLRAEGREDDWTELVADDGATYDAEETIDLTGIVPLIAKPSSPGDVVPVSEVAGEEISQVVIGSSANPGLRDFAIAAAMVAGRQTSSSVSFDINPTSREILTDLTKMGATTNLVISGARIHQAGCMGCIGMGQAPATGQNSLRTMPRNFPGRSGTKDDKVWLCSPETAAASALTGVITDPRDWAAGNDVPYPDLELPQEHSVNTAMLVPPLPAEEATQIEPVKGPNISDLPDLDALPDVVEAPVLLKVGDNISTDDISPAGAKALPYRSNIPKLAEFCFTRIDDTYTERARSTDTGHIIIGGDNYGQGSSREHAAIAPRHLGLRVVIAKSFARIHWQNLANFGVLAVEFVDPADYDAVEQDDTLRLENLRDALGADDVLTVHNLTKDRRFEVRHRLSKRQVSDVLAGGLIPRLAAEEHPDEHRAEETVLQDSGEIS
ncbi:MULTISPECIES: aconitate hydratase [Gordonia]|jgi:aconitate hydratase|uniref:Aconitate hydratase n=1 Tax=Gordonia alkanivorans CGMCC 6845 TaxID=1423140 RepID=W9DHZ8_9ACTN|nr:MULTISPECIES: aconitate hydratase [Gordonia]ETA08147.1 aconitate hydratase [Gordonia alkanivorans CGMCC 6845]MDH3006089.1 aconitate hydratase [Gordonia alkanivorans]MDH3011410.1 aconitate hydratase [Gordonia alkanivorans]MDH3015844.1 aconitate hydratase [Gordonia alkanivorans]MDH3040652.1 aconitate hydratase [Gordonia alkanivorans]